MFLRGWGLATLLGRSCILCFETVLGMNKITPPHPLKIKIIYLRWWGLLPYFLMGTIWRKVCWENLF